MALARRARFFIALLAVVCCSPAQGCQPTRPHDPASYPECAAADRPLLLDDAHRCVGDVCVYADPSYRGGLAVATTRANADLMAQVPVAAAVYEKSVLSPPPFYVAHVAGKGFGLVASASIRKGDYVMVHTPTLLVHLETHSTMAAGLRLGLYAAAVQRLPAAARRLFMAQMGTDVYDKVETNCFRLFLDSQGDSTGHLGCFPAAAHLNHDCQPNLQYHIANLTQSVVAVRDIAPGEELTISYIDLVLPRAARQERLQDWGFACSCPLCRLQGAAADAADRRIQAIEDLTGALDQRENPAVAAGTGAQLADLYEQEGLHIYLGHAYTRAALNFALFGDAAGAVRYAEQAAAALAIEFGPEAPDIASMRSLAADPKKHWAWGLRVQRTK